jgi:hypothetical protein
MNLAKCRRQIQYALDGDRTQEGNKGTKEGWRAGENQGGMGQTEVELKAIGKNRALGFGSFSCIARKHAIILQNANACN